MITFNPAGCNLIIILLTCVETLSEKPLQVRREGTGSEFSGSGLDSGWARAWQYLARSPSGLAKFGLVSVGLRKSACKTCVMA